MHLRRDTILRMPPETITAPESFAIKTDVFEGPLELLLELVERRKLLINDISLAEVTDEYIAQVAHMQERSLPGTAQFVVLAATLLLIKSKSLLPVLELTDEEESSIEELEERLKLYQIYRAAAKSIEQRFGKAIAHERLYQPPVKPPFLPDRLCTISELKQTISQVIAELPMIKKPTAARVRATITLEEMINCLQSRIERQVRLRFSDLLGEKRELTTVIVGFLAILELVKQGSVLAAQLDRFADIEIELHQTSTPRYH